MIEKLLDKLFKYLLITLKAGFTGSFVIHVNQGKIAKVEEKKTIDIK
jgi:hypothetical protein